MTLDEKGCDTCTQLLPARFYQAGTTEPRLRALYLNDDEDYTPSANALRALLDLHFACPHMNFGRRARGAAGPR